MIRSLLADGSEQPALETPERVVSHRELGLESRRAASALQRRGVGPGDTVALVLPRDVAATTWLLGAMSLGAVPAPMDVSWPSARLAQLLDLARPAAIVAEDASRLPSARRDAVVAPEASAEAAPIDPPEEPAPETPVLLLFTSGSTGTPRGVEVPSRAVATFVAWAAERFALGPGDRVAGLSPLYFDLSILDLLAPLTRGGTSVLVPPACRSFPPLFADFLEEKRIGLLYATPTALSLWTGRGRAERHRYPSLTRVLAAGEVFPAELARRLRGIVPHARLFNLYGPAETNVVTCHELRDPDALDEIPIGGPCPYASLRVENAEGEDVGPDEVGELVATGPTLMRGYRGEPDSVPRWPGFDGRPAWPTGDLVQRDADGVLWFRGRRDHLLKHRGFRIHPGEVEEALTRHPRVVAAAVGLERSDEGGRLVGWLEADEDVEAEVRTRAREQLPGYMVPEALRVTSRLPTTSTGKIDRRALFDG